MNRLWYAAIALVFSALCGMHAYAGQPASSAPKRAAIMDFELINEMRDYETVESRAAQQKRLLLIDDALRNEFQKRGLYHVVDNEPAEKLISKERSLHDLRQCNGCEIDIGRALQADIIVLGWVQKVSNLILNVNIEVKDVASGNTLYTKSVDLRGNSDKSWLRGIHYMVDSIEEKHQYQR